MLRTVAILAPLAAVAYYSSQGTKSDVQNVRKQDPKDQTWISDNIWTYLQDPIVETRTIPGGIYEYDIAQPLGPVQKSMSEESDPVNALAIYGKHLSDTEKLVQGLWTDFLRPRREIFTRSTSLPPVTINIMDEDSPMNNLVGGYKFYDRPVPRWTGTDRYYTPAITVPYIHTP